MHFQDVQKPWIFSCLHSHIAHSRNRFRIGRKPIDHALASQFPSNRTDPRAGAALKEEDCWWCGHEEHHATMCKRCDSFCKGAGSDISAIPRALAHTYNCNKMVANPPATTPTPKLPPHLIRIVQLFLQISMIF